MVMLPVTVSQDDVDNNFTLIHKSASYNFYD